MSELMTWSLSSSLLLLLFVYSSANCYKRVMDETRAMQERIEQQLGLDPDDKEVVVLYDSERDKVFKAHSKEKERKQSEKFLISS